MMKDSYHILLLEVPETFIKNQSVKKSELREGGDLVFQNKEKQNFSCRNFTWDKINLHTQAPSLVSPSVILLNPITKNIFTRPVG